MVSDCPQTGEKSEFRKSNSKGAMTLMSILIVLDDGKWDVWVAAVHRRHGLDEVVLSEFGLIYPVCFPDLVCYIA